MHGHTRIGTHNIHSNTNIVTCIFTPWVQLTANSTLQSNRVTPYLSTREGEWSLCYTREGEWPLCYTREGEWSLCYTLEGEWS